MKGFNRKRLTISLFGSTMVATALLAPVSGVYAAPAITNNTIQVNSPARTNMQDASGLNGINVQVTYSCGSAATPVATDKISLSVTQTAAQAGNGVGETADNLGPGNIGTTNAVCNGTTQIASVTVYANGNFNEGTADVTASVTDNTGAALTPAVTTGPTTIRVIQ
jgi:hypothetical protein